jgi:hypothetical protein
MARMGEVRPAGAEVRPRLLRSPAGALALFVLVCAFAQSWYAGTRWASIDFYQFWAVGRAAGESTGLDPYSAAARVELGARFLREAETRVPPQDVHVKAARERAVLETYSTPWLYTLFGAAASGDYAADQLRFQRASTILLALAVLAIARLAGLAPPAAVLMAAIALVWFMPSASDLWSGNVNRVLLAALAAFLLIERAEKLPVRHALAGALLGMAVAFKPNLAFAALALAAGWMVAGRWAKLAQASAGMAAGALGAVALSSVWFGTWRVWPAWAAEVPRLLTEFDHSLVKGNFSLSRLLTDWLGSSRGARLLTDWLGSGRGALLPVVFLGAIVLALVLSRRRRAAAGSAGEVREDLLLAGLGATASLLAAQLAWIHYFLLALPLVMYLVASSDRGSLWAGVAALAMLALEPWVDLFGFLVTDPPGPLLLTGGALLAFAAGLREVLLAGRRPARERSSAPAAVRTGGRS